MRSFRGYLQGGGVLAPGVTLPAEVDRTALIEVVHRPQGDDHRPVEPIVARGLTVRNDGYPRAMRIDEHLHPGHRPGVPGPVCGVIFQQMHAILGQCHGRRVCGPGAPVQAEAYLLHPAARVDGGDGDQNSGGVAALLAQFTLYLVFGSRGCRVEVQGQRSRGLVSGQIGRSVLQGVLPLPGDRDRSRGGLPGPAVQAELDRSCAVHGVSGRQADVDRRPVPAVLRNAVRPHGNDRRAGIDGDLQASHALYISRAVRCVMLQHVVAVLGQLYRGRVDRPCPAIQAVAQEVNPAADVVALEGQ
ncbi:MAG: hypothetical protein A4E29_00929 [Methanomassiliicoccales archaeon PtaB.Bin134]|nr:MAG: hypothetical protein A4E29_00929 [Methanomassiliicoccales archaeon PtaB.Bin134]